MSRLEWSVFSDGLELHRIYSSGVRALAGIAVKLGSSWRMYVLEGDDEKLVGKFQSLSEGIAALEEAAGE